MTVPKNDKYKDYARYAEHCLNMVAATTDQELRCTIYQVKRGDQLRAIARDVLGSPDKADLIYQANLNKLDFTRPHLSGTDASDPETIAACRRSLRPRLNG
jgi:hypothetical protein